MSDIRHPVHASYDDLVRYIQGRLRPERLSVIDPHLLDCDTCRERLSLTIRSQLMLHFVGKAKADQKRERSEPRFSTGAEALVQELDPLSLDRQEVKIVDISKNGLGILGAKAALPGTIMQVRINAAVELGEVRYCSACDGNGYRIGLRFIAVSDESAEHFMGRPGAIVGDLQTTPEQQPDRRRTPRQQLSQSAVVSVLGTGQFLHGEIRNLSDGGTQILLHGPIRVTSLVKIEYADKLFLGEVVYCRQEQAGWLLGIRVERALSGVTDLADAMRRFR
jgi:PilZ domain